MSLLTVFRQVPVGRGQLTYWWLLVATRLTLGSECRRDLVLHARLLWLRNSLACETRRDLLFP